MAVEGNQIHGTIGLYIVEYLFVRKTGGRERGIGPAHALNPRVARPGGMGVGVSFHALLNFSDSGRVVQIHPGEAEGALHEMNVAIGETRQ